MQETENGKTCPDCGQLKSWTEFYRNRSSADGHQTYCKPCWLRRSEASRQRHIDARHAKARETAIRYRTESPEQVRASQKAWYDTQGLQYHRKWQEGHRETVRTSVRKYRAQHLEEMRVKGNNRRAVREGADGELALQEWLDLCARHGHHCAACGEARRLEIDHIVPMKLGGSNRIENIQPLCHACNTRKKQQTTDYRK